jgi:hypothetical protein
LCKTNCQAAVAALAVACAVAPTAASRRQTAGGSALLADLQRDWREQKDLLVKLADAMPADRFLFKPTPAQRTYGEQILHVATGNVAIMRLLGATRPRPFAVDIDPTNLIPESTVKATKEGIVRMLSDAYDFGSAVLAEQTPQTINMLVDKRISFFGGSTRARLVWSLLSHGNDIYGQMVVYARLNGIVV